jgi:hypothetical protein
MYSATKIPLYIKDMAKKLNLGEIRAIHADSKDENAEIQSFIFFIIKATDETVTLLGKNPKVEGIAGLIDVSIASQHIMCVPTLFRFCENPQLTYQLEYNLTLPEAASTYSALGKRQTLDFLFCGETKDRVIAVNLYHLNDHVKDNIEIAKQKMAFNWSEDAYLSAKQLINNATPSDLWEIFKEHGGLLELSKTHG